MLWCPVILNDMWFLSPFHPSYKSQNSATSLSKKEDKLSEIVTDSSKAKLAKLADKNEANPSDLRGIPDSIKVFDVGFLNPLGHNK